MKYKADQDIKGRHGNERGTDNLATGTKWPGLYC